MLTPAQINSRKFKVVHLKSGYDQEEVDDFLDRVQEDYEYLYAGKNQKPAAPEPRTQALPLPIQPQISPSSLERLLVAAEKAAEETKAEAHTKADELANQTQAAAKEMLQAAHTEARQITENARKQAEAIVTDATAEKHRAIGELEEQRAHLKETVDGLIRVETEVTTRMRNALERWNT